VHFTLSTFKRITPAYLTKLTQTNPAVLMCKVPLLFGRTLPGLAQGVVVHRSHKGLILRPIHFPKSRFKHVGASLPTRLGQERMTNTVQVVQKFWVIAARTTHPGCSQHRRYNVQLANQHLIQATLYIPTATAAVRTEGPSYMVGMVSYVALNMNPGAAFCETQFGVLRPLTNRPSTTIKCQHGRAKYRIYL
jgi:hypothetical protein